MTKLKEKFLSQNETSYKAMMIELTIFYIISFIHIILILLLLKLIFYKKDIKQQRGFLIFNSIILIIFFYGILNGLIITIMRYSLTPIKKIKSK